jgi:methionyl-tRNA formyltransferase
VKLAVVVNRPPWPARTRYLLRRLAEDVGPLDVAVVTPPPRSGRVGKLLRGRQPRQALARLAAAALYRRYTRGIARAQDAAFEPLARSFATHAPLEDIGSLADPRAVAWLERTRPDVCVPIDGGIIRPDMLARCRWVRWHHAIMPDLRGVASPFWAIAMNRPDWLGATVQELVEKIDAGAILAQRALVPEPSDDLGSIHIKLDRLVVELLVDALRGIRDGKLTPVACEPKRGKYLSSPDLLALLAFPLRQAKFFKQFGSTPR